jgi:glycoprotein endo-alpha-1,2-mannosidase
VALLRCILILFSITFGLAGATEVSPNVHAFYYTWYGNPEHEGSWVHWDHSIAVRSPEHDHPTNAPVDIGANFYPEIGLYSSNSPTDVAKHMAHLKQAGVGVVSTTWWGIGDYTDKALPVLFDAAAKAGIQVNFHIEPFSGRDGEGFRKALEYLIDSYGEHPALYRDPAHGNRPMVYLYDSYKTHTREWARVLQPDGDLTVRGTKYDVLAIGLWVKEHETAFMRKGGFDGFYTYFATEGFTYGSTWSNWPKLSRIARENNWLFIPSVGPGYEDRRIRPWNAGNGRARENGAYYDRSFKAAIDAEAPIISITSFNEWHEGTQIEPATNTPPELPDAGKAPQHIFYLDNESRAPGWYLDRTRHWVGVWEKAGE